MFTENARLGSPTEMRCYYCEEPVKSDHFPRADEDGSALRFDNDGGEPIQYFAHRSCFVMAGGSRARMGDINAGNGLLAPEARSEVLRRAYRVGWKVEAHHDPIKLRNVFHIVLDDPDGEGFTRDYWVQFVEAP